MLLNKWKGTLSGLLAVLFAVLPMAAAQSSLVEGFKEPPDKARPRVYWYWLNGSITKEGITKDVEWFYRAGIRGMETFDIGGYAGKGGMDVVKPPLLYMQKDWKDAFYHALQEAASRSRISVSSAGTSSAGTGMP